MFHYPARWPAGAKPSSQKSKKNPLSRVIKSIRTRAPTEMFFSLTSSLDQSTCLRLFEIPTFQAYTIFDEIKGSTQRNFQLQTRNLYTSREWHAITRICALVRVVKSTTGREILATFQGSLSKTMHMRTMHIVALTWRTATGEYVM